MGEFGYIHGGEGAWELIGGNDRGLGARVI